MAENLNGVSFEAQRQAGESSELLINHLKRSPAATIMCQRSHQTGLNLIKRVSLIEIRKGKKLRQIQHANLFIADKDDG